jgi:SWI/SNF-related matrix-associated actin-dependent regulator of chromatin subfamily A3
MGLGKTIQVISLILSHSKDERNNAFMGPTLIIAPVSVISNWENQFEDHCMPESLKIYVHHGSGRSPLKDHIESYNIVLTSYQTLASEFGEHEEASPLHQIHWLRIVLDEAHCIRTWKTKQAKAVLSLEADRKWCLTGTPIQNRMDDLYALLAFLGVPGLSEYNDWTSQICGLLKRGDLNGVSRLKVLLSVICLRRLKTMEINGKRIVELPDKKVDQIMITLSPKERVLYQTLANHYRIIVGNMLQNGEIVSCAVIFAELD